MHACVCVCMCTATQVASRLWILWGIILLVEQPTTTQTVALAHAGGVPLSLSLFTLLGAWSASEIIRYSFYAFKVSTSTHTHTHTHTHSRDTSAHLQQACRSSFRMQTCTCGILLMTWLLVCVCARACVCVCTGGSGVRTVSILMVTVHWVHCIVPPRGSVRAGYGT